MRKFLIGITISLGLLFGTTPSAKASVHVSVPVHATFDHIMVTPCDGGVYQVWGITRIADLYEYTLLYQGSC